MHVMERTVVNDTAQSNTPRYKNSRSSSRYGPPLRTEYRVVVENLSSRVSWQVCIFVNFNDFVLP